MPAPYPYPLDKMYERLVCKECGKSLIYYVEEGKYRCSHCKKEKKINDRRTI